MSLHIRDEITRKAKQYMKRTCQFQTDLGFLKQHYGLRKGRVHLVIGTSGGGKSTLMRTIMMDFLENNPTKSICLWLSEESVEDLEDEMIDLPINHPNLDAVLHPYSELDESRGRLSCVNINEYIKFNQNSLLIFDNITTSELYEGKSFESQLSLIKSLKRIATNNDIPVIVVAHTSGDVGKYSKKLIDLNDIRGNKTLSNKAEFAYILQSFQIDNKKFQTIRVEKSRAYTVEDPNFHLVWDANKRCYRCSEPVSFDWLKEKYRGSNSL
jgi:ABC-type glutathione transport system ATPase component